MILDATEALHADRAITLVDSCAVPNHPMIDRIWRERIEMCDVLVGSPGVSKLAFARMIAAEEMRDRMREGLKSIYHRMTGRWRG